jgi:hypothetical protein
MSGTGLDEQNLVLYEVLVLRDASTGHKFFGTQDKVLWAVILRADLEQELRSGNGAFIGMDSARSKFAIVLLQY